MNFFEQQEKAQRNSGRLLLLMVLAVVSLISITSLALGALWQFSGDRPNPMASGAAAWLPPLELVALVSVVIIAVVLVGSLYKWVELRKGGAVIAERLGGRLINLAPQSLEERRLLNVVEEMALASGTPVPPVYVLNDGSINAFAAGLTPQDAVIGVTQGAISQLSREELQGVIAHEFSHIFHGDMRLNTRLVAVLNGILLLGLIGDFLLSSAGRIRSRSKKDSTVEIILTTGLVLWILGYAGTFFGSLIKAAVSRQREFLADASAVQFTRNPDSIAGALKKIGANQQGSQLVSAYAAEFSHMYFAAGIARAVSGLMATHPPLDVRIRRITPDWDGSYLSASAQASASGGAPVDPNSAFGATAFSGQSALASIAAIGEPGDRHLAQARGALEQLHPALNEAVHSAVGAQVVVYGLLLDKRPEQLDKQLQALKSLISVEAHGVLLQLQDALTRLPVQLRLPVLDLAIPALKQMGEHQYANFKRALVALIRTDGRVALHEWALLRIVERNVNNQRPVNSRYNLSELAAELSVVLTLMARTGAAREQEAEQAFAEAREVLGAELEAVSFLAVTATSLEAFEQALGRLNLLKPLQKPRLLKALARCVEHDGRVEVLEAELLRAVADILDCPMPPLLVPKA
ncbi:M48 family metallopeptidase [Ectopseudomonas mendocina]|uniref:M48 family metallopeptidase n=1 Tax=Ectopseudomonas mendocina TaxID=300 RepID=A0ABZ2RH88_ECTME